MEINDLLLLAKNAAGQALESLNSNSNKILEYHYDKNLQRELKSEIDIINNNIILEAIKKSKISYISEESTDLSSSSKNFCWIIDPLDGTVNYIRGIASCGISIALFHNNRPVFGVVAEYPSNKLYWGGKSIGSFCNSEKIKVSNISEKKFAILATGFPARFNFDENNMSIYSQFAKVRMLGSASISLINVANGNIDCYQEENIMIWDVAAGLAIVEGAGGFCKYDDTRLQSPLKVYADNGLFTQ
jgi:myo-inositol-1(or 4)-monophosphatase